MWFYRVSKNLRVYFQKTKFMDIRELCFKTALKLSKRNNSRILCMRRSENIELIQKIVSKKRIETAWEYKQSSQLFRIIGRQRISKQSETFRFRKIFGAFFVKNVQRVRPEDPVDFSGTFQAVFSRLCNIFLDIFGEVFWSVW